MKHYVLMLGLLCGFAPAAWADSQTVTLSVPSMYCALCPVTVRMALENVDGVAQAQVDLESKTATVVYDDQKTDTTALTEATTNAGFPSLVF